MIIIGIILIAFGGYSLYKNSLSKNFKENINGEKTEYKKCIGTVICDAYDEKDKDKASKKVTPIAEFEVAGEKYEAKNIVLKMGAELPVETKVYVWYKNDNPKIAVLGPEVEKYSTSMKRVCLLMVLGVLFILLGI